MKNDKKAENSRGSKGYINSRKKRSKRSALQAYMTRSYVLVTAATGLFLIVGQFFQAIVIPQIVNRPDFGQSTAISIKGTAQQLARVVAEQSGSSVLASNITFILVKGGLGVANSNAGAGFVLLTTPDGVVRGSSDPQHYARGTPIVRFLASGTACATVGSAVTAAHAIYTASTGRVACAIEPVRNSLQQRIGMIYVQVQEQPYQGQDLWGVAGVWLLWSLLFLCLTILIGSFFGIISTRELIQRVQRLVQATTRFVGSNYAQRVVVTRQDEIGQLEKQFNYMAEQLVESIGRQKELAEDNARLAERSRISRELHDAISQDLFSLRMLTFGLQEELPVSHDLQQPIGILEQTINRMIREMRILLLELRPTHLGQLGLAEALKDIAAAYSSRLRVKVEVSIPPVTLDAKAEHTLLRIAQEALSNAVRHANARLIKLELTSIEKEITLMITDDGDGFDYTEVVERHGLGLRLMQERIEELGGTFTLESAPGEGTIVRVDLARKSKK